MQIIKNDFMYKNFKILILFFFISSCKPDLKTRSQNDTGTKNDTGYLYQISSDTLSMLFDKSILAGDTDSYNALRLYYFIRNQFSEFLNYSLLMANKHHYNKAHYDVYYILTNPRWGGNILDTATKAMSDHYLLESRKLGYKDQ